MALDPCPPWTRWEILWAWIWTAVVIYTAWTGVSGWWAMFVVFMSWAGGMSLGMTISSRAERDEDYHAFERSQKARVKSS